MFPAPIPSSILPYLGVSTQNYPNQFRGKTLVNEESEIFWLKKFGDRLAHDESLRAETEEWNFPILDNLVPAIRRFYKLQVINLDVLVQRRLEKARRARRDNAKLYVTNDIAEFFIAFRNMYLHIEEYSNTPFSTIQEAYRNFNDACETRMAGFAIAILKQKYPRGLPADLAYLVAPNSSWDNLSNFSLCSSMARRIVLDDVHQKQVFVNAFGNALRVGSNATQLGLTLTTKMDAINSNPANDGRKVKTFSQVTAKFRTFLREPWYRPQTHSNEFYIGLLIINRNLQDHYAGHYEFPDFTITHKFTARIFHPGCLDLMTRVVYAICRQVFQAYNSIPLAIKLALNLDYNGLW